MSRIRGKNTGPELLLRSAAWRLGARYHLHPVDVPGRPDLCNKRAKVAVFVDGCFWHGCPSHFRPPKTRRAFWVEKIRRNQERRARVRGEMPSGWTVLELFECRLKEDLEDAARQVAGALRSP